MAKSRLQAAASLLVAAVLCFHPLIPAEHWHHDSHTDQVTLHQHLGGDHHAGAPATAMEPATDAPSTTFLTQAFLGTRTVSVPPPVAILATPVVAVPATAVAHGRARPDSWPVHGPPLLPSFPRAPPISFSTPS